MTSLLSVPVRKIANFLLQVLVAPLGYGKELFLCCALLVTATGTIVALQTWWQNTGELANATASVGPSISRILRDSREGRLHLLRDLREVVTFDDSGEEISRRVIPVLECFQFGLNETSWSYAGLSNRAFVWWHSEWGDLAVEPTPGTELHYVALSGDGRTTAIIQSDGIIRVWQLGEDGPVEIWRFQPEFAADQIRLSPRGRRLVVCSHTKVVQFFDVAEQFPLSSPMHAPGQTVNVNCLDWSEDERRLVTGTEDRVIYVWQVDDSPRIVDSWSAQSYPLSVAIGQNGRSVIAGMVTGELVAWRDSIEIWSRQAHSTNIRALATSADGRQLFSGCFYGKVLSHDWETGTRLDEWKLPAN